MESLKLLVVDDDERIRALVADYLTGQGYTCETAGSGGQGLARVLEADFSLVITDVHMPGMTGLEMLTRVRASGNQAPAIVITAHPDEVAAKTVQDLGVSEVVGKPFRLVDLLYRVQHALSGRTLPESQRAVA